MKKLNIYKIILLILLVIIVSIPVFILWAKDMPLDSYNGKSPALSEKEIKLAKEYEEEIGFLANKPRNLKDLNHYKKSADYIVDKLKSFNYEVVSQKYKVGQNTFENIEVTIPSINDNGNGSDKAKDNVPTILIGAHYDSYLTTKGADDNASGVVVLLELAKRFKEKFNSNDYTIKLVFFANEEPPYYGTETMGSDVYAKDLKERNVNVVGMYSLEMLGFYSDKEDSQHYPLIVKPFFKNVGDFVGFVSNVESRKLTRKSIYEFRKVASFPSEGITAPPSLIEGIDFSDHRSFYKYGYKGLMITDTAFLRNHHYHEPTDTVETLDYKKMACITDYLELMFRNLYEK